MSTGMHYAYPYTDIYSLMFRKDKLHLSETQYVWSGH